MYLQRVQKEFTAPWPLRQNYGDWFTASPGKGYRQRIGPKQKADHNSRPQFESRKQLRPSAPAPPAMLNRWRR